MRCYDKDSEFYRGDELPIPIAFPIVNDLAQDNLEKNLPFAERNSLDSASCKSEEP